MKFQRRLIILFNCGSPPTFKVTAAPPLKQNNNKSGALEGIRLYVWERIN